MFNKHKAVLLMLALTLMLLLSACQQAATATTEPVPTEDVVISIPTTPPVIEEPTEAPTEEPTAEPTVEPFIFGMVLVGPKNDHGWSQAHYEAGQYIEENIPGAKMIVFESLNSADKPEATLEGVVSDMVSQGATLIFTTSDEFEEDTTTVAANRPDIIFINASGDDTWDQRPNLAVKPPANLGNVMGRMEDMKAIAGCAAALTTETGSIGYLGPLINDETRRLTASAYLGARYCYDNYREETPGELKFEVSWIGFWFNIPGFTLDPTEVANQLFDGGTDVLISGIDTTEALDVAGQRAEKEEAVLAIPYDYEGACDKAPEVCLGVPFFNWGPSYLKIAQSIKDGTWEQSFEWLGPDWADMTNPDTSHVGWVNGPALTDDVKATLDTFISGLADGSINVWTGPINLQDGTEYIADGVEAPDPLIWYLPQLLEGMTGSSK